MEWQLLTAIQVSKLDPRFEDQLFSGMVAAIEVLKQIHIERGEVIEDDNYGFKKRELQPNLK